MSADKIKTHHLARRAIVYVRQSSAHQVLHNPESRALQYAMRDRLAALGWSEVEVVDEELGRLAACPSTRQGSWAATVCRPRRKTDKTSGKAQSDARVLRMRRGPSGVCERFA